MIPIHGNLNAVVTLLFAFQTKIINKIFVSKKRIFDQVYASVIAIFECCNRNLVT